MPRPKQARATRVVECDDGTTEAPLAADDLPAAIDPDGSESWLTVEQVVKGAPASPPASVRSPRRRNLRIAAFSLLLAAILIGPIKLQLIDDPTSARPAGTTWYRGWRMFRGIGLGFVQVEATVALPDGSSRPLTNDDLFDEREGARKARRIRGGERVTVGTERVPAALRSSCDRLPEGSRIDGRWRKSTRKGWTKWERVEPFVCPGKA